MIRLFKWLWALDTRAVEMVLGFELLRRGLLWITGAADMVSSYYMPLIDLAPPVFWGAIFAGAGIVQIGGVLINGRWRRSPFLRMGSLLFSLIMYAVLVQAFIAAGNGSGGSIQAWTQELLSVAVAFWCFVNINAKWERVRA